LVVQFSAELDTQAPRILIAERKEIQDILAATGVWRVDGGLFNLADRILTVVRDPNLPNARMGTGEQQMLVAWLEELFPPPEIKRAADNSLFLGWDLAANGIQSAIPQGSVVSWRFPTVTSANAKLYSSFLFLDFCTKFGDQVLDLSTFKKGCSEIWDPGNGNTNGARKIAVLTKQRKDKLISDTTFEAGVEKLYEEGEITDAQRALALGKR